MAMRWPRRRFFVRTSKHVARSRTISCSFISTIIWPSCWSSAGPSYRGADKSTTPSSELFEAYNYLDAVAFFLLNLCHYIKWRKIQRWRWLFKEHPLLCFWYCVAFLPDFRLIWGNQTLSVWLSLFYISAIGRQMAFLSSWLGPLGL